MLKKLMLIAIVCAYAMTAGAQDMDPAKYLPPNTVLFVHFKDVTAMEKAWKTTGFYELWQDPKTKQFLKPSIERIEAMLKEMTGADEATKKDELNWAKLRELFPGGLCVFLSDLTEFDSKGGAGAVIDLGIIARKAKDRKDYENLFSQIQDIPATAEKKAITAGGVKIFQTRFANETADAMLPDGDLSKLAPEDMERAKFITLQSAETDGLILMVDGGQDSMKNLILRGQGKIKETLAQNPRFKNVADKNSDAAQLEVFVNLGQIAQIALEGGKAAMAQVPAGQTPPVNLDALAVDDIHALGIALTLDPKQVNVQTALTFADNSKGIGKVMDLFGDNCEFQTAAFASPDVMGYSAQAYDLGKFYKAIETVLGAVYPQGVFLLQGTLMQAQGIVGFNPITEVVDQLAGEIGTMQDAPPAQAAAPDPTMGGFAPPPSAPFLLALGCKDGARIRAAITKLEKFLLQQQTTPNGPPPQPLLEWTTFLDYEIGQPKIQAGAMGGQQMPAWAITDSWVFVASSADTLKATLRRVGGKDTRNFKATPAFKRLAAMKTGPVSGVNYSNIAQAMDAILAQAQMLLPMMSMMSGGEIPPNLLDFSAKPDSALLKRTLGESYGVTVKEKNSLFSSTIIERP